MCIHELPLHTSAFLYASITNISYAEFQQPGISEKQYRYYTIIIEILNDDSVTEGSWDASGILEAVLNYVKVNISVNYILLYYLNIGYPSVPYIVTLIWPNS